MEKKDILIGLLALSFVLVSLGAYNYYRDSEKRIRGLENDVDLLQQDLTEKKNRINKLEKRLLNKSKKLNRTLSRVENLTSEVETLELDLETAKDNLESLREENEDLREEIRLAKPLEKDYCLLAVTDEGGEVLNLSTEIQKGDGEVSVTVNNVFFKNNTQLSVNKAWRVAEDYTGISLSKYDGEVRIEHEYEGYLSVTGDSGGAAFAIAFIAALKNKTISKEVLITGSIESDGDIGGVGDVKEKVLAAKDFGVETVLVPEGQKTSVSGIEVEEVQDIREATGFIFTQGKT